MDQHKQRCEELRKIRIELGNKLGLSDKIKQTPCEYQGPCKGTCPACAAEEKLLNKALLAKSAIIASAALTLTGCGIDKVLSGDTQSTPYEEDILGGLTEVEEDINGDGYLDMNDVVNDNNTDDCEIDPIEPTTDYVLEGDIEIIE